MPSSEPPNYCPNCGACLQGTPIPVQYRGDFGGKTHFNRATGVYDVAVDRTVAWRCPDCAHTWSEYDQLPPPLAPPSLD